MQKVRKADDEEFDIGDDNEFGKVQKLLERKEKIEEEKHKLTSDHDVKINDAERKQKMRNLVTEGKDG